MDKRRFHARLVTALTVIFAVSGCSKIVVERLVLVLLLTGLALASPVAALEVGQKAPDFTLAAPGRQARSSCPS